MTVWEALGGGALAAVATLGIVALVNYEPQPDPVHGWWSRACDKSHTDLVAVPTTSVGPNGMITTSIGLQPWTTCDRYSWYCPDGRGCLASMKPDEPGPSTNEP